MRKEINSYIIVFKNRKNDKEKKEFAGMAVVVQFDGACFGNPGPMGIGVVVAKDGRAVKTVSEGIGHGTNNIAEYSAVIRCLKEAKKITAGDIVVEGDSELIIKQLKGSYKVKNEKLQELYEEVKKLEKAFSKVKYSWIPRERNYLADELSKKGATS
jgi:ribonuclease HI